MSEQLEKLQKIANKLRDLNAENLALKEELVKINRDFIEYQAADSTEDAEYEAKLTAANARVNELEAQLAAKPAENSELAAVINEAYVAAGYPDAAPAGQVEISEPPAPAEAPIPETPIGELPLVPAPVEAPTEPPLTLE